MKGITYAILTVLLLCLLFSEALCQLSGEDTIDQKVRKKIESVKLFTITVQQGGDVWSPTDPVYGTAGDWYSIAFDDAMIWSSDVVPVAIFNTDTLEVDGLCRGWGYSFHSEHFDSVLYVQVTDAEVQFDQSQPPLFDDPISGTWIDSDDVLPLVEEGGGSNYRESNTGVLMQAFLAGQLYDSCISDSYFWTVGYTSESSSELDFYVEGKKPVLYGFYSDCEGYTVNAGQAYQFVEQKSLEWAGDAGLFRIGSLGGVDNAGESSGWAFEFLSYDRGSKRVYHVCNDSIFTNRSTGVIGGWRPIVEAAGWIDSGDAVGTAETNGGTEFRNGHPLCSVNLTMDKPVIFPFNEHLWTVQYNDPYGEQMSIMVGAESGGFKGAFRINRSIDSLYTSNLYISEAQDVSAAWSEDADFFGIVSVNPLSFPRKGASTAWAYLFHSEQMNGSISVTAQAATDGPHTAVEAFSDPWLEGGIAAGWLESDSILAITGRAGGDGVGGGVEEPLIESILARGIYQDEPSRVVWFVSYHSSCQAGTFYLDAYTGELIDGGVGVEVEETPHMPRSVELMQNYPNPFNPSTVIRYTVSAGENVKVTLRIFDLHGRFVITLVDGLKNEGNHSIQWNGRNGRGERVGSGVYLMRLDAAGSSSVRKMIVIK